MEALVKLWLLEMVYSSGSFSWLSLESLEMSYQTDLPLGRSKRTLPPFTSLAAARIVLPEELVQLVNSGWSASARAHEMQKYLTA